MNITNNFNELLCDSNENTEEENLNCIRDSNILNIKSKNKTMATEAYCVKCRAKRDIKDPKETKLKNGRPAVKGTCPKCGTNVFRIGKM